jgi:ATP-dependent Lhr-like helicase
MLDQLTSTGEVTWWGVGSLPGGDGWISLAPADIAADLMPDPAPPTDGIHARILRVLSDGGAWFFRDLSDRVGTDGLVDDSTLETALWDLAWSAHITNDTIAPLRSRLSAGGRTRTRPTAALGSSRFTAARGRTMRRAGRPHLPSRSGPPSAAGRWSLTVPRATNDPNVAITRAEALLARYGIVTRAAVTAERTPGGFAGMYRVLSAFEEAGRCRRAYALEGLGGAQFAAPGAVDELRELDRMRQARMSAEAAAPPQGSAQPRPEGAVVLAAADPAQPWGALLPWPAAQGSRPTRAAGAFVVLLDGELTLHLERGGRTLTVFSDQPHRVQAAAAALVAQFTAHGIRCAITRVNGEDAASSPALNPLLAAGLRRAPRGLRI